MNIKVILLIAMLIIPLTINTVRSETNNAILITSVLDYGINVKHIDDPVVYTPNVLTTGHLPIRINLGLTSNKELSKTDINKLIGHRLIGSKEGTFEYKLLVNTTFSYQTPRVITEEYTYKHSYIDNKTGKEVIEEITATKDVIVGYDNHTDYKWVWKDIKNLNELTLNKDGFIIIDIVGKFKASTTKWSIDVIPTLEIEGTKTEFKQFAWWDANWANYRTIKVDGAYIESSLNYFPMLVVIPQNIGSRCNEGKSIRFVNVDNLTEYYYEIEGNWSTTGNNFVWVNVTHFVAGTDFVCLMYYNNPVANDNQKPANVWSDNYIGVWHMNSTGTNIVDRTGSPFHNATKATDVRPTQKVGVIGYGQDFESTTSDYADVLDHAEFDVPNMFIEFWFIPETLLDSGVIGKNQDAINTNSWAIYTYAANKYGSYILRDGFGTRNHTIYHNTTYDSSANANYVIYTPAIMLATRPNHVAVKYRDYTSGLGGAVNLGFGYGRTSGGNRQQFNDGIIDEIRISSVIRNHSYINLSHAMQNWSEGSIITIGPQQPPATVSIVASNPANNSVGVCPCSDALCIYINTTDGSNINISFVCVNNNMTYYNISNVPSGNYCICLCALDIVIFNKTYQWHVNGNKYADDANVVKLTTQYFTTAIDVSNCTTSTSSGLLKSDSWLVGIIIVFSMFGLMAYIKQRRYEK